MYHSSRIVIFLLCAALSALAIWAQPAAKEPIPFTGHGGMFDSSGRQMPPSLAFIRETQAWYRKTLVERLTREQSAQFDAFEKNLMSGLSLDPQSRLIAGAYLLDWLINRADANTREHLIGKNAVMKLALEQRLPELATGFPKSAVEFKAPPELLRRITPQSAPSGTPLALVTSNGGAAYRTQCMMNGVPVPPDWGTTGWVSRGQILSSDVFISSALQAEVFTWQSTAPPGMCIALPRFNTSNSIKLLGVICLGTTSSKACFYDNEVNGVAFFPQVGAVVPFSQFGGGTDLVGDVCTDCHAGENPYIIHPNTVLGSLQGLGLPTFANNWYEPIVRAGWPQNPGPMPSPGACATCHIAGGSGRQFPHLSTDFPLYCSVVLNQAITRTMPTFNPGSLASDPHPIRLQSLCSTAPGGSAGSRGDPHLTTVDGVNYDFQSAGEFIALRGPDGVEIQTRQSPVSTASPAGPNGHTGLTNCVSLNIAVAARVGSRRVTFQPRLNASADPGSVELRIDGVLTTLGPQGLDLGSGGRVAKAAVGDGIEIDFPSGVHLSAVPGWWGPPHNRWYLNLDVVNFSARQGIMGNLAGNSWLPALPNGASLGPRPAALHQRYVDLYQRFADAWRVTDRTSLFDYAPGTSTATFTNRSWPSENGPCVIPRSPQATPLDRQTAVQACRAIEDKNMNADCVFDVAATGNPGFAKTYLISQRLRAGSTMVIIGDEQDPTPAGRPAVFRAAVTTLTGKGTPTGSVQFTVDGVKTGSPIKLERGVATWTASDLQPGTHQIAAVYTPESRTVFVTSASRNEPHVVQRADAITIDNLPMQGGDEKTPCPPIGVTFKRSGADAVPYLKAVLPGLDKQCAFKGPGLVTSTIKFVRCTPDPRGAGFGPVASADLTCAK
jgi:hypothetical protein